MTAWQLEQRAHDRKVWHAVYDDLKAREAWHDTYHDGWRRTSFARCPSPVCRGEVPVPR